MKIESMRTLAGPNIYTHSPALLMRLDLQDLEGRESRDLAGFNRRLLALLPGLREHHCARGRRGGFVERLEEGTYFGHVVEHVALELTQLAGVGVTHGKTRGAGGPGRYNVVIEYVAERGTRRLLERAVGVVESLVRGEEYPLDETLEEARGLIADTELGPSTRAIVDAAERRGIPWTRLGEGSLVQLGHGCRRKIVQAAATEDTSAVACDVASDKDLTKKLLGRVSIRVPRGLIVRDEEEAVAALAGLGGRVVAKPLDGRQGRGVSLDLRTPEEVRRGFRHASVFSDSVIVEEQFEGKNYRVLVVGYKMIAASERIPCHVTGDGEHTISGLVEIANRDPLRGEGHEKPLTRIVIDEIALAHLSKAGLGLEHVPAAGERVYLRESINLSTGGTARDVTDEVHPTVARACERAARVVGLDICGVDLVLPDIARPLDSQGGGFIELNAAPGLRMHLFPAEGRPRDVGDAIVELLYPRGASGRVPLISVTGTNGKTTVTRMIAHVFSAQDRCVGMTTTDGIWIGGDCVERGDTSGAESARAVLCDPAVEVAVLETARGGIARRGLGYDWSDVSVITNIQPDHFGRDGVESIDDLVYVKSLVAERVREGGTLVLNADDEELSRLTEIPRVARTQKRVVYFSLHENHVLIRKHVGAGGTAYFVRGGWIVEAEGREERRVVDVASVPVTLGGSASYQAANALAAVAACRGAGASCEEIAAALSTFGAGQNPGRANLFRTASGGYVMLDYGHNPEAFRAVCRAASLWKGREVAGVVGVPGDRRDDLIEEAGRVAARGFNRIVIREDEDTRGRARGEVAEMLLRAVRDESAQCECEIVLDEKEALRRELDRLRAGGIVVVFYEKLEPLARLLAEHGALPVQSIEGVGARVVAPEPEEVFDAARFGGSLARRAVAGGGGYFAMADEAQGYNWR
jgi:cyanophycin synthetase